MSNDVNSKYTYPVLDFLSLTSYPFQDGFFIPGLVDNRSEALTIGLLSQVSEATEQKYPDENRELFHSMCKRVEEILKKET